MKSKKDSYNSFIKEFFPITVAMMVGIGLSIIARFY